MKQLSGIVLPILLLVGCGGTQVQDEPMVQAENTPAFEEGEQGDWGWYKDTEVNSVFAITENEDGSQLWLECFLDPDIDGCAVMMAIKTPCEEDTVVPVTLSKGTLSGETTLECWGGENYFRYYFEDYELSEDILNLGQGELSVIPQQDPAPFEDLIFSLNGSRTALRTVFEYFDLVSRE